VNTDILSKILFSPEKKSFQPHKSLEGRMEREALYLASPQGQGSMGPFLFLVFFFVFFWGGGALGF